VVSGSLGGRGRLLGLLPFDIVVSAFWGGLLLIHLVFMGRISSAGVDTAVPILSDIGALFVIAAVVIGTRRMSLSHRVIVRLPIIIGSVFGGFWVVGHTIHAINPYDMEAELLWFDQQIWGATFGEWIEPYSVAWVTDILQLCYASYYFLPLALFVVLYFKNRYQDAHILITAIAAAFLSNFLLYILVPAQSPYVIAEIPALAHLVTFQGPLPGSALTHWLRHSIEAAEFNMRDCFPSGHTYISLVTLLLCWRYERKLFVVMAPIVAGLIMGTLYLRYHYIIDLVAGALMAILVARLVPLWWQKSQGSSPS